MRKRRSWRSQERLYKAIGRDIFREAKARQANAAIGAAITELEQYHRHYHRGCKDEGPDTCPTWAAIYGLRELLK